MDRRYNPILKRDALYLKRVDSLTRQFKSALLFVHTASKNTRATNSKIAPEEFVNAKVPVTDRYLGPHGGGPMEAYGKNFDGFKVSPKQAKGLESDFALSNVSARKSKRVDTNRTTSTSTTPLSLRAHGDTARILRKTYECQVGLENDLEAASSLQARGTVPFDRKLGVLKDALRTLNDVK